MSAALDQFRERTAEVSNELRGLSAVAERLGARTLNERIQRDLVKKLDEDRFHLVVVGEFNHGKSTFVNALLGREVLATGVTPTTATIHHLRYADTPEAIAVFQGGRRETIPFDKVSTYAVGGGGSAESIDFLEIGFPAPLLRERILLVDTPGVNDLSLARADITYGYIPRADAVLFLLDAGQILKESERVFLQEKVLKQSRDKIVFVITKWDLLSASERDEAFGYAKAQLSKLVPEPVIFPIAAEKALSGEAGWNGLDELVAHLTKFLGEERGRIMLDNALGEGLNVAVLLGKGIDAQRRTLAMKADELERRIRLLENDLAGQAGTIEQRRMKIREDVRGIKVAATKDLERFVADVERDLPKVIDAARSEDLRQYLPAFLEETFKSWAERQSKEIAHALEELAEKTVALVREDANEAGKRVAATLGTADMKPLDVKIDTFRYDVGIFALLTVGSVVLFANALLGGLLLLAAPVMGLVLKGQVDQKYRDQAKKLAPEVLKQTADKIGPKIDEMIEDFTKKLDAWVVTAGEELHREVLEVLRSARDQRASGSRTEAEIRTEVDEQEAELSAKVKKLEELRAALWTPATRMRVADEASGGPSSSEGGGGTSGGGPETLLH
jgi:small GTP-binding protein